MGKRRKAGWGWGRKGERRRDLGTERGGTERQIGRSESEESCSYRRKKGTASRLERGFCRVTPPTQSQQGSLRHWLAGTVGSCLQQMNPAEEQGNWPYKRPRDSGCLLTLNVMTPHSRKGRFSLSPMSRLVSLPCPLTQQGPPPTPTVPKGKSAPSPGCQCPSAMSGQRQQARSCQWGGVGARVKYKLCLLPNPQ